MELDSEVREKCDLALSSRLKSLDPLGNVRVLLTLTLPAGATQGSKDRKTSPRSARREFVERRRAKFDRLVVSRLRRTCGDALEIHALGLGGVVVAEGSAETISRAIGSDFVESATLDRHIELVQPRRRS